MFGLGMGEVLVLLVLALVLFGGAKLPQLARSLGKGITEFRRETSELTEEFRNPGK